MSESRQVDEEIELGRLLDGQVGRLFTFENPPHVDAELQLGAVSKFCLVRPVPEQRPGPQRYAAVV
jgi:hypothetical protein